MSVPSVNMDMILTLLPDALTIAVLAGIESLLSCVVSDGMIGSRHKPNMELVAQGAGNIVSDFGECLTRLTISLQPLILYATINKIAAMAGIGIQAAYGISTTSTI